MRWAGGLAAAAPLLAPLAAHAGAWPQAPGATQVIVGYEEGRASSGFDGSGRVAARLDQWRSHDVAIYAERGITQRFTITGKINLRDGHAGAVGYKGFGSAEIGGRWTVHRSDTAVLAVGASVEGLGKGRRYDFDSFFAKQGTDVELRAYGGRSLQLYGFNAFTDVQVARRWRQSNADQWRVDATLGVKPSPRWMVLAQVFAGQTDQASWGRAEWTTGQLSVVRNIGPGNDLSLQVGVRQTLSGRNVPKVTAVVVGLWKNF